MAEVVLFHHAQGLTDGVRAIAGTLGDAGHTVHLPDLYDGRTFDTLEQGVAYATEIGFGALAAAGAAAVAELSPELVYAGYSLGVVPAQRLAQTRPGAAGAVFIEGCLPVSEFGARWPVAVPVQIHGGLADDWFAEDLPAAEALVAEADDAEFHLYRGTAHLFADSSSASYDRVAAERLTRRVLEFLARVA